MPLLAKLNEQYNIFDRFVNFEPQKPKIEHGHFIQKRLFILFPNGCNFSNFVYQNSNINLTFESGPHKTMSIIRQVVNKSKLCKLFKVVLCKLCKLCL